MQSDPSVILGIALGLVVGIPVTGIALVMAIVTIVNELKGIRWECIGHGKIFDNCAKQFDASLSKQEAEAFHHREHPNCQGILQFADRSEWWEDKPFYPEKQQ